MCLMILLVYLLLLLSYTIRICADIARIIRVCEGRRTKDGRSAQGDGYRLYRHRPEIYTPSACHPHLHTAETPPPACHVVNDWGFFYATPSDGIYTGRPSHLSLATGHQFLSVRCSTPRDARTKRQHNAHRETYGGLIMLTSRITTPPPLLSPNGYAVT